MCIGFAISGLGYNFGLISSSVAVSQWFSTKRPLALSIGFTGISFFCILFPVSVRPKCAICPCAIYLHALKSNFLVFICIPGKHLRRSRGAFGLFRHNRSFLYRRCAFTRRSKKGRSRSPAKTKFCKSIFGIDKPTGIYFIFYWKLFC